MTDAAADGHTIRVFLAEDHPITIWGLQRLIEGRQPAMRMMGTATTLEALLADPALAQTDVLLLDLDLGGENSAGAIPQLLQRCPGHILVLTGTDAESDHRDAVLRGARGVLHKSEPATTILRAIEKVHAGEVWLNRGLLGEVLGRLTGQGPAAAPREPAAERLASLTRREREIIATMGRLTGGKQLAIADALGMSEHTLRNHLTTIYAKLEVRGRLEVHLFATRHGLLGDDPASRPDPRR